MEPRLDESTTPMRLSELNRRLSTPVAVRWLTALVFAAGFVVFVVPPAVQGTLGALPIRGDGTAYDAAALQLSKGNGFSFDWDDPEYRAPYEMGNADGQYDYLLQRHGASPTASLPPLLPYLMSLSYRAFGRQFGPVLVLMCLFMSMASALAFLILSRRFGVIPGLLAVVWFLLDWRSRLYARRILTESLAAMLLMLSCWCLLRIVEQRKLKWAVLLGLVTGLGFLARSLFIVWAPFVAVLIYILARPEGLRWRSLGAWRLPCAFVASFLVVSTPWMVRNCLVLKRFWPLGTAGPISMYVAYSDEALAHNGIWTNPWTSGFFDGLPTVGKSPLEQEVMQGAYSTQKALEWMKQNPWKLPWLAFLKVRSEWQNQENMDQTLLLGFAALGWLVMLSVRRRDALCLLGLFAAPTLGIALTWSVQGRFLIPLLPVLTILSALGMWSFLIAATEIPLRRMLLGQSQITPPSEEPQP